MAGTMLSRPRPQPLPAMARSKSLCLQQSQSLQESRWRFRSFPYNSGEVADYSPDYAREVADYRPDYARAAFQAWMKPLDSLNTEENPSRLPLLGKGLGDDNSTYYKEHNQTTGSDDYNPSESLLPSDSPHAYTDYDERGNVATVAFLGGIVNGKVFMEWVNSSLLKAYHWQVSNLETTYREISEIYDIAGVKGLSQDCIQKLPQSTFYSSSSSNIIDSCSEFCCSICLQELKDGENARELPICGHTFHVACIDQWLKRQASCPMCRLHVHI